MTETVCVVPARMSSSRFPGKPLVDIDGLPMVVRSARRALEAGCFQRVVVASEDVAIVEVAKTHGLESLLTPVFATGTDRVAWASRELKADWVVNLQGDEPVFPIELLRDLTELLPSDPDALWTAADLGLTPEEMADEDVVKILVEGRPIPGDVREALDFLRCFEAGSTRILTSGVHVGVYAGSTSSLERFASLPQSLREQERRIEPLRAIDAGIRVKALVGKWNRVAVDRLEHISRVLDLLNT